VTDGISSQTVIVFIYCINVLILTFIKWGTVTVSWLRDIQWTTFLPVPNYAAWWERHSLNNLPRVLYVAVHWPGSNRKPLST